jgi:hypothetical protein
VHPVAADRDHLPGHLNILAGLDLTPLSEPAPNLAYLFKHAITQEVTYQLMLSAQRRQLHQSVAEWFEDRYRDDLATYYPRLAHHYTRAAEESRPTNRALVRKALEYLQKAGEQALGQHAYQGSKAFFQQALILLKLLPSGLERTELELKLQVELSKPLALLQGWGSLEIKAVYDRAWELCRELGETPQLFSVAVGLWSFYLVRTEMQSAQELARQLLSLAQLSREPVHLVQAHWTLAANTYWLGDLRASLFHCEQALALYQPAMHAELMDSSTGDPGITCRSMKAAILALLGYPEQALAAVRAAVGLAEEFVHPHSIIWAKIWGSWVYELYREFPVVQQLSQEAFDHAVKYGLPAWQGMALIRVGWVEAEQGQAAAALPKIQQGLSICHAIGFELEITHQISMLSEAYVKADRLPEALAVIEIALEDIRQNQTTVWAGELLRLKGEYLLAQAGSQPEQAAKAAEAYFREGLALTRQQQARALELRLAISLARLWHNQGRSPEAYELLAPVYHWFSEGLATANLREAKTWLDILEAAVAPAVQPAVSITLG